MVCIVHECILFWKMLIVVIFSNYKPFRDGPGLLERYPSSLTNSVSPNKSSGGLEGKELVELNFLSFDSFIAEVETSSH